MRLAFVYDARAWNEPRARWTMATLAPLLDAPWRELPMELRGERGVVYEDELVVYVGDPNHAPTVAAVTVPLRDWPVWSAAWLQRVEFDEAPFVAAGSFGPPVHERDLPAEWLIAMWHAISREEEREDPRRDQWECFSGSYARFGVIGMLETPWVNLSVEALRRRLDLAAARRGAKLERVARWKHGAPFAVALSHDVDDVRLRSVTQALRLLGTSRSPVSYGLRGGLTALARSLTGFGRDPYARFERWAEEEARRGFRSTFFVFARPAGAHEYDALYALGDRVPFEGRSPKVGTMFRALADAGFEIGLHGSYESWRNASALGAQRQALGEATGQAIGSTRQHFLRFDVHTTWAEQEKAGFTADATLGYNEAIGFRSGLAAPFHPWDPEWSKGRSLEPVKGETPPRVGGRELLEVPLTLMDGALFRGMKLAREEAIRRTILQLEAVEAVGGMAGLLWHPNAAAESLFPGWWECFAAAMEHLTARGAWVAGVGEIASWWRKREERLRVVEEA